MKFNFMKAGVCTFAFIVMSATGCVSQSTEYGEIKAKAVQVNQDVTCALNPDLNVVPALKVAFSGTNDEQDFCQKLIDEMMEQLQTGKIEFADKASADLFVDIKPVFELEDSDSGYYKVVCKRVSLSIKAGNKIYASKVVEPKCLPRKLSVEAAKTQYVSEVSKELVTFMQEDLKRLADKIFGVCNVNVKINNYTKDAWEDQHDVCERAIVGKLKQTDGVINFENLDPNHTLSGYSYRVVYLKEKFPQGFSLNFKLKFVSK